MDIKLAFELYGIIGLIVAVWQLPIIDNVRKKYFPNLRETASILVALFYVIVWPLVVVAAAGDAIRAKSLR